MWIREERWKGDIVTDRSFMMSNEAYEAFKKHLPGPIFGLVNGDKVFIVQGIQRAKVLLTHDNTLVIYVWRGA